MHSEKQASKNRPKEATDYWQGQLITTIAKTMEGNEVISWRWRTKGGGVHKVGQAKV
jgi:hypothetical protein